MLSALNDQQVQVLHWIADGCPDGVFTDPQGLYKLSAYALRDRGLVTVRRRRNSWEAAITERGLHYLLHGPPPPAPPPPPKRGDQPPNTVTINGRHYLLALGTGRLVHLVPPGSWPMSVLPRAAVAEQDLQRLEFAPYDQAGLVEPAWSSRTLCNHRWSTMLSARRQSFRDVRCVPCRKQAVR